MKGRQLLRCILLLLPAAVLPAQQATVDERPRSLEEIDQAISALKSAVWKLPDQLRNPGPETDGRTLEDDINEFLQTDALLKQVEELRHTLPASIPEGSDLVPANALAPLTRILVAESCRIGSVGAWWILRETQRFHLDLLESLVERLPASERSTWEARWQPLVQQGSISRSGLLDALASCERDTASAMALVTGRGAARSLASANALRQELAFRLAEVQPDAFPESARPDACPVPDGTTSGRPLPAVRFRPDVSDYYPAEELAYQVAGLIRVRIILDDTGCVTHAKIVESSGSPGLDEAAKKLAFGFKFIPGEVDGKPVGGGFIQPVSFNLREGPQPQPQP